MRFVIALLAVAEAAKHCSIYRPCPAGFTCVWTVSRTWGTCEVQETLDPCALVLCEAGSTCHTTKDGSATCLKDCQTTCGASVPHGWEGNDDGPNECNSCFCTDGLLGCTELACPDKKCPVCTGKDFCGGIANLQCGKGQVCIDNPDDGCDPKTGGADCGGCCVEEEAKCCPAEKEPGFGSNPICFEGHRCCPDGTWSCSIGDGKSFPCGGEIITTGFGEACKPALGEVGSKCEGCPALKCACVLCPDGVNSHGCCGCVVALDEFGNKFCSGITPESVCESKPPLQVNDLCDPGNDLCGGGLTCCYPCGIQGCQHKCMLTCTGGPACSGGCVMFP